MPGMIPTDCARQITVLHWSPELVAAWGVEPSLVPSGMVPSAPGSPMRGKGLPLAGVPQGMGLGLRHT